MGLLNLHIHFLHHFETRPCYCGGEVSLFENISTNVNYEGTCSKGSLASPVSRKDCFVRKLFILGKMKNFFLSHH